MRKCKEFISKFQFQDPALLQILGRKSMKDIVTEVEAELDARFELLTEQFDKLTLILYQNATNVEKPPTGWS